MLRIDIEGQDRLSFLILEEIYVNIKTSVYLRPFLITKFEIDLKLKQQIRVNGLMNFSILRQNSTIPGINTSHICNSSCNNPGKTIKHKNNNLSKKTI